MIMKIEKLTDNKIRVLVNSSEFDVEKLDITTFLSQSLEDNTLLSNILRRAHDEIGFNTDGCKLLIESFFSSENILVFTITKYSPKVQKKKLSVKKRDFKFYNTYAVFKFNTFEDFCLLCERINNTYLFEFKKFIKNISLYLYNNTYYLFFKNIDISYNFKPIYLLVAEFASPLPHTSSFENKLLEHGKVIIKNNAISTGIKYFVSNAKK